MNGFKSSTDAREILLRITAWQASATDRLFSHCMERFRLLSCRIFSTRSDLRSVAGSDDMLPDALARLHGAVARLRPETTGLSLKDIRRALRDLVGDLRGGARELPLAGGGAGPPPAFQAAGC